MTHFPRIAVVFLAAAALQAQTKPRNVVGTVAELKAESAELVVRTDAGETHSAQLSADTQVQRIAPGQTSLRDAEAAAVTDIAAGDRVLVTFAPDSAIARRIVLMSAGAISKRNEADRRDWQQRGVAGLVASKKDGEISLRIRSMMAESTATVRTGERTEFRRYATGSVKFADAKPSSLAEVREGDQLRARGVKSEDGGTVTAEEVVFGSFVTKAGEVVAVADARLTLKETGTEKTLQVAIAADTQLKRMPEFGGPGGGPGGPGGPGGFGPGGQGGFPGRGPGGPGGTGGPGGPRPDMAQMFDRFPSVTMADVKPGDTVVFSSTVSPKADQFTAIMLVSNADGLVRMAAMRQQQQQQRAPGRNAGAGPGIGGFLDFPTMMP